MIGGRRPIKGRKPADRASASSGRTPRSSATPGPASWSRSPRRPGRGPASERAVATVKAWLFGRPLAIDEDIDQRLSKKTALPIFSSDAISSSAYATEEILRVLVLAGAAALFLSIPSRSRSRSCWPSSRSATARSATRSRAAAAPTRWPARSCAPILGLVAAAALLIDYVMTVAVSTSSAMDQLISIAPGPRAVAPAGSRVGVIALITVGNLRGLRESGNIFAIPTYLFVGLALLIVAIGVVHIVGGTVVPAAAPARGRAAGTEALTVVLLLARSPAARSR